MIKNIDMNTKEELIEKYSVALAVNEDIAENSDDNIAKNRASYMVNTLKAFIADLEELTQPHQTVSKEIQFIKHTLKAIIRWHRDERNPKNFPISSTLDALNYLDKLQANQTNEVTECECGHTVPLDYAVTDGEHWTCMPCHIEWLEEKAQTNEGEFTLEDVVENLENNINELKKLISC